MKVLLFALLTLFSSISIAEQKIETIQLNHRLAVDVLAEVQAFLPEKATARAFNDFIIIKAENDVIQSIRQLIHKLDTPPQRLRITVLKTSDALHNLEHHQLAADINVHNHDISGSVSVHARSTKEAQNNAQFYRAQGLANKPIFISMGEDIPQSEHYLVLRSDGDLAVQSQTAYFNIESGFRAVARILPNQHVTLDIHPQFSEFSNQNGIINSSQIITSLSGPIGAWLELGQVDNEKNIQRQGTATYHHHENEQQHIYIKVDPL